MICNAVRTWLELPISACVLEDLSLQTNKARLNVTSVKTSAELLRLGQRYKLKHSKSKNMNELWAQSTLKNVPLDSFINANSGNCDQAKKALRNARQEVDWQHINSLQLQGALIRSVTDSLSKASIKKWSSQLSNVATPVFRFVCKALQQQLPTATNLVRWESRQTLRVLYAQVYRQTSTSCPIANHPWLSSTTHYTIITCYTL